MSFKLEHGQTNGQINTETGEHRDEQTNRQTDKQIEREAGVCLTAVLEGRRLVLRCALDLDTDTSSKPTARTTAFRSASSRHTQTQVHN